MSDEKSKNETILTITNQHFECCGVPPQVNLKDGPTCYFENEHGEQVILQYDNKSKTCRMWHGDVGWEEPLKVVAFRGHPIVLFARTKKERDAEFKMNTQFDPGEEPRFPSKVNLELKEAMNKVLRKSYGKPRLTEEECEMLSNSPVLSKNECSVIISLWEMWHYED